MEGGLLSIWKLFVGGVGGREGGTLSWYITRLYTL